MAAIADAKQESFIRFVLSFLAFRCISIQWLSLRRVIPIISVRSGLEKEPLQVVLKEGMREFLEKVSERMLKLQLEEDKELQKEIKQRDSLFILLEKMVG